MQLVQVDPPLSEELPAHTHLSERRYTRAHGAAEIEIDCYPIFVPKMREEVSRSFCVPV